MVLDCAIKVELEEPELPDLELPELEEFELGDPELVEPEPVEPDPVEPELDPEVLPEPLPEPLPGLLPLDDTLPASTTLLANKLTPPVVPPELVTEPLALMLCAVAVTWLALVTLPEARVRVVAFITTLL